MIVSDFELLGSFSQNDEIMMAYSVPATAK